MRGLGHGSREKSEKARHRLQRIEHQNNKSIRTIFLVVFSLKATSWTSLNLKISVVKLEVHFYTCEQKRNKVFTFTVEAPRHEAGFRVIFGPQNDALQNGLRRGKHRPASPKVLLKNEARQRSSSESYTVHKIRSGSFAKFCMQLV